HHLRRKIDTDGRRAELGRRRGHIARTRGDVEQTSARAGARRPEQRRNRLRREAAERVAVAIGRALPSLLLKLVKIGFQSSWFQCSSFYNPRSSGELLCATEC